VLCKVSWLLTTSVLPDTNGETDKFEVEAAPSVEAAGGDVMTTAFDAVEDVQFEGRTLSQMLPWHLKVKWQVSALTAECAINSAKKARYKLRKIIF